MRHLRMHAPIHTLHLEGGRGLMVCMQPGGRGQMHTHRPRGLLKVGMASGLIVCLGLLHVPEQGVTVFA